jgi:hypothetical protein
MLRFKSRLLTGNKLTKNWLRIASMLTLLTISLVPSAAVSQRPPVTSTPKSAAQTTITIQGKARTCGELTCENPKGCGASAKCNANYQRSFDRWGSRIDKYVTSGRLGPLGNAIGTIDAPRPGSRWRYQDLAAAGLAACYIADRGGNEDTFINYMLESNPGEDRIVFLPLWFGAQRHLCPDVKFRSAVRGKDRITP